MKKKIIALFFVFSLLFVVACSAEKEPPIYNFDDNENIQTYPEEDENLPDETIEYTITLDTVFSGGELSTVPESLKAYMNAETRQEQLKFLVDNKSERLYRSGVCFSWTAKDESSSFTVTFADNKEFKKKITVNTTDTYLFDNAQFVPGKTYYWKVTSNQTGKESPVDSFVYSPNAVRIIDVDGADNIRDLGGWKTEDGNSVRFGKIFRGARINNLGATGRKVLADDLGIQTEIDLRNSSDDGGQNSCAFGADRNYLKVGLNQYCYILPQFSQEKPVWRAYDSSTPGKLKQIFSCLADESNYPIYFHCNAGADRTGTLAFLINGLLGVGYDDLVRDFELTSFSKYGQRWRGAISDSGEQISDVMQDDSGNYVAFDKMYKMMMTNYAGGSGSLSNAVENYLKSVCGVTADEISSIRNILLVKNGQN